MTTAKQVPALVAAHQDYLRSYAYQIYTVGFFNSIRNKHLDDADTQGWGDLDQDRKLAIARGYLDHQSNMLNISQLYHVSEPMTEVAKVAARQLAEDERWTLDILPSRQGVLVFEKPLVVMDVWQRLVTIAAVYWEWTDNGVSFCEYTDITTEEDDYNRLLKHEGKLTNECGRWSMAHVERFPDQSKVGPWMSASDLKDYATRYVPSDTWPDDFKPLGAVLEREVPVFGNVTNLVFAIFALMDQTVANLSEETDRKLARRIRGKNRPPPMVTVITLRREDQHGYREPGTGNWLTYRSVTMGHFRKQHYGPNRQLVKRIWINPYMRGPDDAPLWQPKRVHTLKR